MAKTSAKDAIFPLRISSQEREKWAECAAARGMSISEWVRFICNAEALFQERKSAGL